MIYVTSKIQDFKKTPKVQLIVWFLASKKSRIFAPISSKKLDKSKQNKLETAACSLIFSSPRNSEILLRFQANNRKWKGILWFQETPEFLLLNSKQKTGQIQAKKIESGRVSFGFQRSQKFRNFTTISTGNDREFLIYGNTIYSGLLLLFQAKKPEIASPPKKILDFAW